MKRLTLSIVTLLTLSIPLTSIAVTSTFAGRQAFGEANLFSQDDCSFTVATVLAFENASRTQPDAFSNAGLSFSYTKSDTCLHQFAFVAGSITNGVTFKKAGKTITVSGLVPVEVFVLDTATFQIIRSETSEVNISNIVLTQSSEDTRTSRGSFVDEHKLGTFVLKTVLHLDTIASTATASGSVINPIDGSLINFPFGRIGIAKSHTTTITR